MKKRINFRTIYILSFLLMVAFLFNYVHQISSLARETYLIEGYQRKIEEYSREKNSLEYSLLENNSFTYIDRIAKDMDFVEAERPSYIKILSGEVVVR